MQCTYYLNSSKNNISDLKPADRSFLFYYFENSIKNLMNVIQAHVFPQINKRLYIQGVWVHSSIAIIIPASSFPLTKPE